MKFLLILFFALIPSISFAEDAAKPAEEKTVDPETVDISDLEKDYWRPNKDELEVVQNRRFDKKGRFEAAGHFGILQGEDFEDSKSWGFSGTYNLNNLWFAEASYHRFNNSDNDFLGSVKRQYNFTPNYNREQSQTTLQAGWVPIYAKFSLLGKKISHFELYLAAGPGITKTIDNHLSGHFTVGNKFYLTENLLFRVEWRMTRYKDKVIAESGSQSLARGGPGSYTQIETTHNIIFGLGWMF
jgi:outer membrane beta-barrel protein